MIGKSKSIAHGMVALSYAINKKGAQVVLTNNLSSYDAKSIYKEMIRYHSKYSNAKNRFIRTEISPHPKNGKRLTEQDFEKIAKTVAKKLSLHRHQWVAVIHNDTKNPHLHMIFNRADYQMRMHDDAFISNKTSRATEEIAYEMDLIQAKEVAKTKSRKKELDPDKKILREKSLEALKFTNSYEQFCQLLENDDIEVVKSEHKTTGKIYGHKFLFDGKYFKASMVDRKLSYKKVMKTIEKNKLTNERHQNRNFAR